MDTASILPSATAPHPDERREQLLAAARRLRDWIYVQRRSWTGEPESHTDLHAAAPPPAAAVLTFPAAAVPPPVASAPAPVLPVPEPAVRPIPEPAAPPIPERVAPPIPDPVAAPIPEPAVPPPVSGPVAPAPAPPPEPVAPVPQPAPPPEPVLAPEPFETGRSVVLREPTTVPWGTIAAAVALVAVLGGGGFFGISAYRKWAATPRTGTLVLESSPDGTLALVDGKEVGTTPLTATLDAGDHVVEFRQGNSTRTFNVTVTKGGSTTSRVDWKAKTYGGLQVDSTPPGARVSIDGKARGVTPLTIDELPTGNHTLVLDSSEGSVRRTVSINEGETLRVSEAIFSGFMHVSAPVELQIYEGGRRLTIDDRNQVMLKPGVHKIRFVNRDIHFETTKTVEVKPGDITAIDVDTTMSAISVTSTVAGDVYIDGEKAGATPLTDYPIAPGTREIVVKTPGGQQKKMVTVTVAPAQVDFDFPVP